MKKLFIFICLAALLAACGVDPADTDIVKITPEPDSTNDASAVSAPSFLESVEIGAAQTLVLKKVELQPNLSRTTKQSVAERCDELGTLDNAVYNKIPLQGNQTPCFKNVHFWDPGMIYGQYRPSDTSPDVWFITGANGKVHHLPGVPKKDRGFKNDKIIRKYQGKPTYLTQDDFLAVFDMSTDQEENLIESRVGRFVVIPKINGDHIFYTDLMGGKRRRPDGSIDEIPELNETKSFYRNPSNDLGYTTWSRFKNFLLDASGDVFKPTFDASGNVLPTWLRGLPRASPVAADGGPYPSPLSLCEKDENLLICEDRGFVLADSSQDLKEINWQELGISGDNSTACLMDGFIYYAAGSSIHKIVKDLSASEEILTDFSVYTLQCPADNQLIIHGLNVANSQYETFQLNGNIRTMITEDIAQFIR